MNEQGTAFPLDKQTGAKPPVLLILLGASNMAHGYSALMEILQRQLAPRPLKVLAAFGPGRGYCAWGGILGRIQYPPIGSSILFKKAEKYVEGAHSVHALVTDVGNDILYGVEAEEIIETVKGVQDRLLDLGADVTTTQLPSYFEQEIPAMVFYGIRTLLFPSSKATPEKVREAVLKVNQFLKTERDEHIHCLPAMDSYLSWDHIHYSLFNGQEVWTQIAHRILQRAGFPAKGKISFPKMILSYEKHLIRLLFMDLLKIQRRDHHLF